MTSTYWIMQLTRHGDTVILEMLTKSKCYYFSSKKKKQKKQESKNS